MRNFLRSAVVRAVLGLFAVVALGAAVPPVANFIEGQVRRSDGLHIGSKHFPVIVEGNMQVTSSDGGFTVSSTGAVTAPGVTAATLSVTAGVSKGVCTLNGASPSVCTDTVTAGTTCVCTIVGGSAAIAAKGVACDLSSTTLTATSANSATEVVNWLCF